MFNLILILLAIGLFVLFLTGAFIAIGISKLQNKRYSGRFLEQIGIALFAATIFSLLNTVFYGEIGTNIFLYAIIVYISLELILISFLGMD